MSADRDHSEGGAGAKGRHYPFQVDGRAFVSDSSTLTGAQIKSLAGIDPAVGLFLEGRGAAADTPVGDADVIDLSAPGHESFYSMPGATYGVSTPLLPLAATEE